LGSPGKAGGLPKGNYWNIGIGPEMGKAADDQKGIETMRQLGENMAWMLKKIKA